MFEVNCLEVSVRQNLSVLQLCLTLHESSFHTTRCSKAAQSPVDFHSILIWLCQQISSCNINYR